MEVEGEFPSAPLFAYLDAIPLRILTDRNPSTGGVQLSLVAPNQSAFGPVRMVWAEKQIVGDVAVNVRRRSVIEIVAVPPDELKSGAYLRFAFLQEPLEVHLAGKEIPRTHFKWEGGYLIVQIPKGAASGQLLVVTRTQVFQSSAPVQIKNP